ncbi:MAG: TetR/AcrR family transcriptional regulator [Acidimicrobiales bacterium]
MAAPDSSQTPHPVPPSGAVALDLPGLAAGLPPAPPPDLDPYLDAAIRCFARYGVGRTTVQDIARELAVDRTTVYRRIGGIDDLTRALVARELRRLLAGLPAHIPSEADPFGPEAIVELVTAAVSLARDHAVLAKVLADEQERIGPFLTKELATLIDRVATAIRPLLEMAMEQGGIARRDPRRLSEWLVRTGISVLVSPPRDDLRSFLSEVLVPALTPDSS